MIAPITVTGLVNVTCSECGAPMDHGLIMSDKNLPFADHLPRLFVYCAGCYHQSWSLPLHLPLERFVPNIAAPALVPMH